MIKEILYISAVDASGEVILAQNAVKGNKYSCSLCSGEMILRKSGNTGKNSKRPHFSHKSLISNCTPESVLHHDFKMLVAKKIQLCLDSKSPLKFSWDCIYCKETHSGDLLKKISRIEVEYNLTVAIPDITLFDKEDRPFAVIEVVVTHPPEKSVLNFYRDNDIILVKIEVSFMDDIYDIDKKLANPDFVEKCFNPKCDKCDQAMHKAEMTILNAPCWSCKKLMNIAYVKMWDLEIGPDDFREEWLKFATDHGVLVEEQFHHGISELFKANTCQNCGNFIGEKHLFKDYTRLLIPGRTKSFDLGYNCERCYRNDSKDLYD